MKIGVKYCGGCNPVYNRVKMVEQIMNQFPEHTFSSVSQSSSFDICLLVSGCARACVSNAEITAHEKTFALNNEKDFAQLHDYLPQKSDTIGV